MFAYRSLAADDPKIREHLLALPPEDRRCRFHGITNDERIERYCAEMAGREAHLVGCFEGERLVGLIEIAICHQNGVRHGEIGMSVAADRRDLGIGHRLVEHALDYAANHRLRLIFGYLPENIRIPRIVLDLGGHVDRLAAEAEIDAPEATAFSLWLEAIDDLGLFTADIIDLWRKSVVVAAGKPPERRAAPSLK